MLRNCLPSFRSTLLFSVLLVLCAYSLPPVMAKARMDYESVMGFTESAKAMYTKVLDVLKSVLHVNPTDSEELKDLKIVLYNTIREFDRLNSSTSGTIERRKLRDDAFRNMTHAFVIVYKEALFSYFKDTKKHTHKQCDVFSDKPCHKLDLLNVMLSSFVEFMVATGRVIISLGAEASEKPFAFNVTQ